MTRLMGYAEIHARSATTFAVAGAPVLFRDAVIEDGRAFLVRRGDRVAAAFELGQADAELIRLADAERLVTLAEIDSEGGLDLVRAVRIGFASMRAASPVWIPGRHAEGLSVDCRNWRARAALASMSVDHVALPAPDRPVGAGPLLEIGVVGEIGEGDNRAESIISALRAAPEASVRLSIDSIGGNLDEALGICAALAAHPKAVFVAIEGTASSAAALVALQGDVREIAAHATMLLHPPHITVDAANAGDLKGFLGRLEARGEEMARLVAARAGRPLAVAREWLGRETSFSAGEAVEQGLAHSVAYDKPALAPDAIRARFAPINGPFAGIRPKPAPAPLFAYGGTYARGSVVRHAGRTFVARRDALAAPGLEPDRDTALWRRA